jgi:hypothetical protein
VLKRTNTESADYNVDHLSVEQPKLHRFFRVSVAKRTQSFPATPHAAPQVFRKPKNIETKKCKDRTRTGNGSSCQWWNFHLQSRHNLGMYHFNMLLGFVPLGVGFPPESDECLGVIWHPLQETLPEKIITKFRHKPQQGCEERVLSKEVSLVYWAVATSNLPSWWRACCGFMCCTDASQHWPQHWPL